MDVWKISITALLVTVSILTVANLATAHNDSPGLIHSCVKENGSLTIVGPDDVCKSTERALDWNQQGVSGVSGYEKVENHLDLAVMEANAIYPVQVDCSDGKKILGGGAYAQGLPPQVIVLASAPERGDGNDYWNANFLNTGGPLNNVQLWVVATCATMAP